MLFRSESLRNHSVERGVCVLAVFVRLKLKDPSVLLPLQKKKNDVLRHLGLLRNENPTGQGQNGLLIPQLRINTYIFVYLFIFGTFFVFLWALGVPNYCEEIRKNMLFQKLISNIRCFQFDYFRMVLFPQFHS